MPFDGLFISKLVKELEELNGYRIQKINQVGNLDFLLVLHKNGNKKLFISLERNEYRICLTDKEYVSLPEATTFLMVLRKHFEGGVINSITQYGLDRIITLNITNKNDFYDTKNKNLILEMMGKNSNLIITDDDFMIIDALKKIGVSETGSTILPHSKYNYPTQDKVNIYDLDSKEIEEKLANVSSKTDMMNTFSGFSPIVSEYILNDMAPISLINNIVTNKVTPSIFKTNGKDDYYFKNLGELVRSYDSLSMMLEDFYYAKTIEVLKGQKSSNLKTVLTHIINKLKTKISKLEVELDESEKYLKYEKYGKIIISNLYQITEGHYDEIKLFSYEDDKEITIPLDSKISVKENSKKYFNKANKLKSSKKYIIEQIDIAKNEIEYLELIKEQIDIADIKDLDQIKEELISEKYLKDSKKTVKKNNKIDLLHYQTSEGILIYVGKNNIQNDYLTHKLSKSSYTWFHAKDAPGSHVVVFKENELNEEEIRTAAMLAAYYSKFKDSSSVAVDFTKIKNLKKVPGKKNCFVTMSTNKTIYIDPDKDQIEKLKR